MPKITIDWENRIFDVNSGETTIDVRQDVYSEWKRQIQLSDNAKWPQAMVSVGGEALEPEPSSKFVPSFYFLLNDWKVRAYIGTDTINLGVNLFASDGTSATISGGSRSSFNSTISEGVTNLVEGTGVTPADILAIAQGVWDENLSAHTTVGSTGRALSDLYKIEHNRWRITGNQMVIYDDDGVTPFKTFDLKDKLGNATEANPFERSPV